jgi:hypothetical protein
MTRQLISTLRSPWSSPCVSASATVRIRLSLDPEKHYWLGLLLASRCMDDDAEVSIHHSWSSSAINVSLDTGQPGLAFEAAHRVGKTTAVFSYIRWLLFWGIMGAILFYGCAQINSASQKRSTRLVVPSTLWATTLGP